MKQSIILILLNCCRLDCLLTKALFPFDIAKIGSFSISDNKKSHKNFILWLFIDLNQTIVCAHNTFLQSFHTYFTYQTAVQSHVLRAHSDYLLSFHVTPSLVSLTSKPASARASRI